MGFLIETSGSLDLKAVREVCLDEVSKDYNGRGQRCEVIRDGPIYMGDSENYDCYSLGMVKFDFEGGVPKRIKNLNAYRVKSVQGLRKNELRFLAKSMGVLPNWVINLEEFLPERVEEAGSRLNRLDNVKEVWHYWNDNRGRLDLAPMSWLDGVNVPRSRRTFSFLEK